MKSFRHTFFKSMLPAFVGGVGGALIVTQFRDDRVIIGDYPGMNEMRITHVDGVPSGQRSTRFFIPARSHTQIAPGKRTLTISDARPDQTSGRAEEHTIEVDILKGLEYRLGRDRDKMPILIVTKI